MKGNGDIGQSWNRRSACLPFGPSLTCKQFSVDTFTKNMEIISDTATCEFVGEGAANAVFTLGGVDDHLNLKGQPYWNLHVRGVLMFHNAIGVEEKVQITRGICSPTLPGQLLRVPKHNYEALPYADLQAYWETQVFPLFKPHELVQQRLVHLPSDPSFLAALNQQLHALDKSGVRRRDFAGHVVSSQERIGMLVEDMRAATASPGAMRMHEIKPKWLAQSPRAPPGAPQCRNCAREVWRNMKNQTQDPIFCPLNLVKAGDFPEDDAVAADVTADLRRCYGDRMTEVEASHLTAWLRRCELLRRLRRIQWENDHEALVENDEQYCLAMTLRDCSLFVLLPKDEVLEGPRQGDGVVAKLGDTDMKNYAVKKEYWMKMEQEFHDCGVYWNSDKLPASLTDCQLPFYRAREDLSPELKRYYS